MTHSLKVISCLVSVGREVQQTQTCDFCYRKWKQHFLIVLTVLWCHEHHLFLYCSLLKGLLNKNMKCNVALTWSLPALSVWSLVHSFSLLLCTSTHVTDVTRHHNQSQFSLVSLLASLLVFFKVFIFVIYTQLKICMYTCITYMLIKHHHVCADVKGIVQPKVHSL